MRSDQRMRARLDPAALLPIVLAATAAVTITVIVLWCWLRQEQ
jgi:hypothetical protein